MIKNLGDNGEIKQNNKETKEKIEVGNLQLKELNRKKVKLQVELNKIKKQKFESEE